MSETNNETAVRSRTTSTTSPSKAKLTPLVPGKEDPNRPLVELTHVEKHFGALHVLKDINLTVTKGEVLVVVGPSGSGKSTMCRTINRLETIDSGDIRIDGKPLPQEGKELANLRAEVGMVFQSFNLFANKTILENVTLALIKVRHMDKKEAEQLAMDLLARVGVDSQASKMPSQLSGGLAREAHLVGHADHRHAFMREFDHHVEHFVDHFRVECGGGLVEQHDLGAHGERAGDGHTLLLAAGKLCGVGIEFIAEADLI